MKKVAFYTLGCKVNQYETEAMLEMFKKEGYTQVDSEDFADVYVINTCTVTHMSDRKSRQYIRRMKKKILLIGTILILSVILIELTGCTNAKNETVDNKNENSTIQKKENLDESKDTNIKLDTRYTSSSKDCQIDLYSDNTMYLAYVSRTGTSEYYNR